MKKYLPITFTLLLSACGGDSEDKNKLKNLDLASVALSECVSQSAEHFGYEYISDVENLSCSESVLEAPLDQSAFEEMKRFENLKNLFLGLSLTPVHFDGSAFPALQLLRCDNCGVQTIDLSKNSELNDFEIWENKFLTDLDLSNNPKLSTLFLSDVIIINLDLGKQDLLEEAYIVGNGLSESTLSNIDFSGASALKMLEMFYIDTDYLDLSNNLELERLDITFSNIKTIDIGSEKLTSLTVNYSDIVSLDTSMYPDLAGLVLIGNQIGYMNLDNNEKLQLVNLSNNPLSNDMIEYLESATWIDRVVY